MKMITIYIDGSPHLLPQWTNKAEILIEAKNDDVDATLYWLNGHGEPIPIRGKVYLETGDRFITSKQK